MSSEFNHLLPKNLSEIQSNIQVESNPFSKLLPKEEKQKFKLTTKGNPGSNLSDYDKTEPNPFGKLLPTEEESEDIDGDKDTWEKVKFAMGMGFSDTWRGGKQLLDIDVEEMKKEQRKLYEYMENPDGSTNYMVAAAYFGSALLDPAGWLIPVTKAKTLYQAAKYGFVSSGIIGGLGYVDEESILDTRGKQAAASALGGTILSPVIAGVGKKLKGEKVFTRESLGIPGFDSPSIKAQADIEANKMQLLNEAGKKNREAFVRKKQEVSKDEYFDTLANDKTKLLQGPRLWFRENVIKPYEKKFGKPALNYLTNGEYGAEVGTGTVGGLYGYATADEDAPVISKFSRAFTYGLIGSLGVGATRFIKMPTRKVGAPEEEIEITETLRELLGRGFIDGYRLPKEFKGARIEANGMANHIAMRFADLAEKIQKNFTVDERKVLFNILEGDTVYGTPPKTLKQMSKEARSLINEIGQSYVDLGLITRETFEKNKNTYLKRTYLKFKDAPTFGEELKRRGAILKTTLKEYNDTYSKQKAYNITSLEKDKTTGIFKLTTGKKTLIKNHKGWELSPSSKLEIKKISDEFNSKISATKSKVRKQALLKEKKEALDNVDVDIRWEYTKPQRVGLGEIEDAAFAIAETGRAFAKTISQYRFYDNLSKQNFVYATKNAIPANVKDNYIQMPTTIIAKTDSRARYGNLAGKYVPREVYRNLVAANRYRQMTSNTFLSKYRELNSLWKVSKTAWNPTVHVNNIFTNVILHDLIDADYKYLKPAFEALKNHNKTIIKNGKKITQKSKLVEQATKYGVLEADFVNNEIKNIKTTTKFPYDFKPDADEFSNSVTIAKNIYGEVRNNNILSKLTDYYRLEDHLFRLSVFQDRLAKGYSIQDAAFDARKSFVDYNIDAPAINFMRNSVTPFLAYTYRIIPIIAETAILRPWKYVKYASLGYGLNAMGELMVGGDEEAERAVMPERKQGRFLGMEFLPHRNIKLPVTLPGKDDTPLYMDFTRFVPGGDILDLGSGAFPGVPAPLQPSGGAGGEILFGLVGYDLFRQQKLKGQTGIASEDWKIRLSALKDRLIPNIPLLPGSYSSKKLEQTRKGMDSTFVADQPEYLALAQTLGFKIEKADISKLTTVKTFELKRKLDGFKEQINIVRNEYRRGLINQETAQNRIDLIAKKMRELSEKYGVYFEKATYSQPKKPFEDIKGLFERKN